ncbi:MAG: ABC transporter permease [Flavobacteriales bacterium CG_4_10_14_0_2_um_filter_32_8]|nr:MAG: ABC transporter permease [Flavobacteriales bacterium CG_4_10_14_0_2_um_filter_32_8]PJB15222.1 MAG: ABC transporter permease [Flavobacteriales bacterium CG_4_9_14_3_um_filter_32_8]
MNKLIASLKKETLLLFSDKIGLSMLFLMPVLLVFIITIIQDSAYKMVNENKVSLLVSNQDSGELGNKLILLMNKSGLFNLEQVNASTPTALKETLLAKNKLTALFIPQQFSLQLTQKAAQISQTMTYELGLREIKPIALTLSETNLTFYHDPILQENYSYSITNVIASFLNGIENELLINTIYTEVGIENSPETIKQQILSNKIGINQIAATNSAKMAQPNSTQHNVPAWTIFAMFFMVVSLGSNIVKERLNGSFLRLKTMPTNYLHILSAKMIIYMLVAFLQFALIFSIGMVVFPFINLPQLVLPSSIVAVIFTIFCCSLAAVSYALMIGALAKTQEQSNGFGAISIIIFAALGGIWVPTFVMPNYLQLISNFSPMHWCLEGFYILFLKDGSWTALFPVFGFLLLFSALCQTTTYIKLKIEKII